MASIIIDTSSSQVDTIVLYALEGQYVEIAFEGTGTPTVTPTSSLDIAASDGVGDSL